MQHNARPLHHIMNQTQLCLETDASIGCAIIHVSSIFKIINNMIQKYRNKHKQCTFGDNIIFPSLSSRGFHSSSTLKISLLAYPKNSSNEISPSLSLSI